MVELSNVKKKFDSQTVFDGFSLSVNDGERIAIMGRSGAGKTTLINLILGLEKPDSGKISVAGISKFGVVFQEDRLIESLSAKGNVSVQTLEKIPDEEMAYVFSKLRLSDELLKKPTRELSGGEKRRVAIARALLSSADAFIFDEPLKGIDTETLESVVSLINEKTSGKTFILVTHSEEEACLMCEKIIRI